MCRIQKEIFVVILQVNEMNLENVTHEDAVAALKATQEHVKLVIAKPTYISESMDHGPPCK